VTSLHQTRRRAMKASGATDEWTRNMIQNGVTGLPLEPYQPMSDDEYRDAMAALKIKLWAEYLEAILLSDINKSHAQPLHR